jgi:hypothetical protein
MKKRIFSILLTGAVVLSASAQVSKTLSPYSQFGLGTLADQSQGFNRGMGGLSIGFRDSKAANMQNPASYSAVDSLTMIFDMGVSGQLTNFKEGGKKINRKTADFDYAVALFRVLPHLGMSFGVVPYSNIGYSYEHTDRSNPNVTHHSLYTGDGGLSQAYLGVGYELVKGFSLGANVSYFWGSIDHGLVVTPSESASKIIAKTYSASIRSFKFDFGTQFQTNISKNDVLTLGATLGLGNKLGADYEIWTSSTEVNTSMTFADTTTVKNAFKLPLSLGIGATLLHKQSLLVGVDYQMQRWGDVDYPQYNPSNGQYEMTAGVLKNRHKVTLGADYIPDPNPLSRRNIFHRVHYRAGVSYATPYYNIKGQDGPKELSVSAGFGIPLINSWNNRSVLNISAQWVRSSTSSFITENTFRINIGLTFNERWFAKWKVD